MLASNASRTAHPCLDRGCGHLDDEHVLTPELAAPGEVVVWCVSCRRHETRRGRRWLRAPVPVQGAEGLPLRTGSS